MCRGLATAIRGPDTCIAAGPGRPTLHTAHAHAHAASSLTHHVGQGGEGWHAHPLSAAAPKCLLQPAQVVRRLRGPVVCQLQATICALPAVDRPLQGAGGGGPPAAAAHAAVAHAALPAGARRLRLAALDRVFSRQGQGEAAHRGAAATVHGGRRWCWWAVVQASADSARSPRIAARGNQPSRHGGKPWQLPPDHQLTGGYRSGPTPPGSAPRRCARLFLVRLPGWRRPRGPSA